MKTEPTPAERAAAALRARNLLHYIASKEAADGQFAEVAAIIAAHVPTDDSRRLDQLQVAFGQSDDEMDLLGVLLKIRQGMTLRQAVDACLGGLTVGPDAHVPAEARGLIERFADAAEAFNGCRPDANLLAWLEKLGSLINLAGEARAFLASNEDSNDSTR